MLTGDALLAPTSCCWVQMCPHVLINTCLPPLRLQTAPLACVPYDTQIHTVQRRLGLCGARVPGQMSSCLLRECSTVGSRVLSLLLHLPSSVPGGFQPILCRDPGTYGDAHSLRKASVRKGDIFFCVCAVGFTVSWACALQCPGLPSSCLIPFPGPNSWVRVCQH